MRDGFRGSRVLAAMPQGKPPQGPVGVHAVLTRCFRYDPDPNSVLLNGKSLRIDNSAKCLGLFHLLILPA